MTFLVSIDELKTATGYSNTSDVEKCLQKNGIRVIYGKKGHIFTTPDAINKALGLSSGQEKEMIDFIDDE